MNRWYSLSIAFAFILICHVTLAMKFRVPDSMQEKVSTLQNEEQFCELSKLIENNLQLFLNANVDHHFVWYTLSQNTLHCGDTLTALKYLEEAFILGLTTQHAVWENFIPKGKNAQYDKLCVTYTKVGAHSENTYFWGAYLGMLLIIIAYNFVLFISLRELSFLLLAIFVFITIHAFGLFHSELGNYIDRIFPWIDELDFIQRPFVFCLNLSLTVYILFIRQFFDLREKWWSRINTMFLAIGSIACLSAFFGVRFPLLPSPYDTLILVLGGLLSGILVIFKRIPHAKLFFGANLILSTGYLYALLEFMFHWDKIILFAVFGPEKIGLILFLLLLSLTVSVKINRLKTEKIELQEDSLRHLETRVRERTQELNHEKMKVEEKNTEILSSIEYARRIQTAILPPMKIVRNYLHDSFILYMPKDIVAGDFYWMENIGDTVYFAACDCTGHGVPGAMVSVVCHNALNRAVNEFSEREPGKILDKTRELVVENFGKSEDDVKDGMDISLCALNTSSMELRWAGANNPLWIFRSGTQTIEEHKPDKQPIGKGYEELPFTSNHIELQKGDIIYLFTDGYADQFGGEKGKKLTRAKFREFLLSISKLEMDQQREALLKFHNQYRSTEEQVDDICVMGVRI